jgi:hypothetical protein
MTLKTTLAALAACIAVTSPFHAFALPQGQQGLSIVKQCIMHNDPGFCRAHMTPSSYDLFDRFASYKLMPCLPTDFSYVMEKPGDGFTEVRASFPESANKVDLFWVVFATTPQGPLIDLPQTFRKGFGPKWQNRIMMAEQVYLMMRENMGDNLTCDTLTGLFKPNGRN